VAGPGHVYGLFVLFGIGVASLFAEIWLLAKQDRGKTRGCPQELDNDLQPRGGI
jgi:hypothetical protein